MVYTSITVTILRRTKKMLRWREMDPDQKANRLNNFIKALVTVWLLQNIVGLINNLKLMGMI